MTRYTHGSGPTGTPTFVVATTAMPAMIAMTSEARRTSAATRRRERIMTSPELMESFQPTESSRPEALGVPIVVRWAAIHGLRKRDRALLGGVHVVSSLVRGDELEAPQPTPQHQWNAYRVRSECDGANLALPHDKETRSMPPPRSGLLPRGLHSSVAVARTTTQPSSCYPARYRALCAYPVTLHRRVKGEK